ncbi:MAG: hypothetical protein HY741_00915 [Chloroflexi bacterium]|nr:hypothetical protein [Chloroflexota bacterium]
MKIPNAERAEVDIRKLRDYCLNPDHFEGKHKARLFAAAFGMTARDAAELSEILLQVVKTHDAVFGRRDGYGQRYVIDFMMEWRGRRALVRCAGIIENDSTIPHLTTCYPL